MENITRIQPGQNAQNFVQSVKTEFKPAEIFSFSIYFKGTSRQSTSSVTETALSVICKDQDDYDLFYGLINGFMDEIANRKKQIGQNRQLVERWWNKADAKEHGKLTLSQVKKLCIAMNVTLPENIIEDKFKEVDLDHSETLEPDEFIYFIISLMQRWDVAYIWNELIKTKPDQSIALYPKDKKGNTSFIPFSSEAGHHLSRAGEITMERFHDFLVSVQTSLDFLHLSRFSLRRALSVHLP